jgi:hypothetical protein
VGNVNPCTPLCAADRELKGDPQKAEPFRCRPRPRIFCRDIGIVYPKSAF